MADEIVSQNFSINPDPQEKPVSGDDITPSQEQQTLPDMGHKRLVEWLARINTEPEPTRVNQRGIDMDCRAGRGLGAPQLNVLCEAERGVAAQPCI